MPLTQDLFSFDEAFMLGDDVGWGVFGKTFGSDLAKEKSS